MNTSRNLNSRNDIGYHRVSRVDNNSDTKRDQNGPILTRR